MAASDWRRAFGFAIDDNPFDPSKPINGMASAELMVDLSARALPIHREPRLAPLFCHDVGNFARDLDTFRFRASAAGYNPEPLSAGTRSFLTFIGGPKGSGKTTLANVMVEWLSRCTPDGVRWHTFDPWADREFDTRISQLKAMKRLKKDIDRQNPSHCCVLLDNLIPEAKKAATNLYVRLSVPPRRLFLFLLSSEQKLIAEPWKEGRLKVNEFFTDELTPDQAVNLVRSRLAVYRPELPAYLADFPLFPFHEEDVRRLVDTHRMPEYEGARRRAGSITLRQFGGILAEGLLNRMQGLPDGFQLARIPREQIKGQLILLGKTIERRAAS
jgi:hypothetical protein